MKSYEIELVTKVVSSGGSEKLIAQGIESKHFSNAKCVEIWEYLTNHVKKYKSPPDPKTVQEQFPEFKWKVATEPLEYIADRFIAQIKRRKAVEVFQQLAEVLDEDDYEEISAIDETFLDKAKELAQELPSSKASKFSAAKQRILLYEQRKKEGLHLGIPYGIEDLDKYTLGIHPHQYVTLAGYTGIGKSTLGMQLAVNHYLEGATPMIVSLEMDEDEVYRKLDGIAASVRQSALKEMNLSGAEMKRWEKTADRAEKAANDIVVVDIDFATADRIYAETVRWNPDVVLVDYIQLMIGPKYMRSDWEKVDFCSKMLKAQARSLKIPIYGISQTNAEGAEEGANLGNLAGSKRIASHSDLVLGMNQDEAMFSQNKMELNIKKNRAGPSKKSIYLYWDQPNSEFRQWNSKTDAFKANEQYN